jgi:membrane protein implicated in regulation of membrane protease activity
MPEMSRGARASAEEMVVEWPNDGLAFFFLLCFFIGLLFTVASFFLGLGHGVDGAGVETDGLHVDTPVHLNGGGHGDAGGAHAGGTTGAEGAAAHADATSAKAQAARSHGSPSPINLSTIMAFLTWFGGAGYILRAYYDAWPVAALAAGIVAGLAGAVLVFSFLSKVLYASQSVLDPRDYHLPGTLARVTSPIRTGGTGEIMYTKGETRQVTGARSVDGQPIAHGAEVVIMRYERGLAYVQRWDDLMREEEASDEQSTPIGP